MGNEYVINHSHSELTNNNLQELSTSTPSGITDASDSNIQLVDSYVPWFIDAENLEGNDNFEPEGKGDLCTSIENPNWEYQGASILPFSNMAYQDSIDNSNPWSNLSHQQPEDSSSQNEPAHLEQVRAVEDYSFLNVREDEQKARLEISMPATNSTTFDEPPSPKRRKARKSSTASASIPTAVYRKGHNAIEKRYRSKLNDTIQSLEECLPNQDISDDEDSGPQRKTKSAILTRAVTYIESLKQDTTRLTKEKEDLNRRFKAFEKLALGMVERGSGSDS